MKIDDSYDIPYAGGYSIPDETGTSKTIYIDRDIPEFFTAYDGKTYHLRRILIAHELRELSYILEEGMEFNDAHKITVNDEVNWLRNEGIPIDEYYGHLHTWVMHCLDKYRAGMAQLPADLDLRPYLEDGILLPKNWSN